MKKQVSPLPSNEARKRLEAAIENARKAVKHQEENGQKNTYWHNELDRLQGALDSMEDLDNGTSII